ncbi:MAG: nicotinate-nucleotide adenylyltransferase, partial [Halothiobacillaceae bacterium]
MIGLLGGTFDPVHLGHLRLAEEVREALALEKVRFLPAARPPHRDDPQTDGAQRLRLVELAVADHPNFVVDDREFSRAGRSYTVDTLASIREEIGQSRPLVLIMGMDAFNGFTRWHRWADILEQASVAVATRPGAEPGPEARDLLTERGVSPAELAEVPAGRICCVPITRLDISATAIRERLARGGSLRYLVPEAVRLA